MIQNPDHIVIAGGSGFLGQVLARHFLTTGRETVILTRSPASADVVGRQVEWDGRALGAWVGELEGAAAVINLAGKSVNCRYHRRNRREILESRVEPTRVLGQAIARCARPPSVWLNASTATIYRHTLGEAWDESGEIGATREAKDGFSIEVARAWERTFEEAVAPGTRKVLLRAAMVLGLGANSVFPMLRRLVRLGLGGKMGSGRQFVSWIHQADYCRSIDWLLTHPGLTGPINLAGPHSIPNSQMMQTLRELCGVPFGLPATEWMLEIGAFLLGTETELIIKSRRVVPGRLLESGFTFQFCTIREAFQDLLNASGKPTPAFHL